MSHSKTNAGYEPFHNQPEPTMHSNQPHSMPQYAPQVMVQQPQMVQAVTFSTDMPAPRWSWCNLITSMFSILCCWCFGIIAMVMALLSYTDHKSKDFQRSRHKRNVAWVLSILAIVIGSLLTLVIIVVYVKLIRDAERVYGFNNN